MITLPFTSRTRAAATRFATLASIIIGLALQPAAFAAEKVYNLKFGTLAPDNTPWSKLLVEFKSKVEAKSAGRIKMKNFLTGVLGDERAMLQKMKFGQLTGGGFSTSGVSTVVPDLQLLELPFLFRNSEETDHILDKVVRTDMADSLRARGFELLMWAENGWLDFGNKEHPVRKPEDLKGIKWFTQESDVMLTFWKELGATSMPLSIPEVLSALQTGIVDGYANTAVFATGTQWFTQSKFWTVSHHMYQPACVIIDSKFWAQLPDDLKKIVTETAAELETRVRADVRGLDKDLLKGFESTGMKIDTLTESERAVFEKATSGVATKLIEKGVFKKALYEKVTGALTEFRKKGKK